MMANVFKGMSQTNFLDGLALKSGLNGHALFDYLCRLIDADNKTQEKCDDFETYPARTDEVIDFTGTRDEFVAYCHSRGAGRNYTSSHGIAIEHWMNMLASTTGARKIIYNWVNKQYWTHSKTIRETITTITQIYD